MKRISPQAFHKVRKLVIENSHPLCILIDKQHRLSASMGELDFYGFPLIKQGDVCLEHLPFLVGHDPTEATQIRFLETPNGRSAHVYIQPEQNAYTVTFLDASEQQRYHGKMQQKANDLALLHDEQCRLIIVMEELQQQLEDKRIEVERANSLKSKFIANMSHEFRTPLTSILGFTTLIKQNSNHQNERLKYLSSIERGAKHLLSMIENLLEQSRFEAEGVIIHSIASPTDRLFNEVRQIFEPLADDRNLRFSLTKSGLPDYLQIDELRVRQILFNLIGNAIKFTDQGQIKVIASWHANELKLVVSDTGTGIKKCDQERIFDPFKQLDKRPGSGLGLSIVKQIVGAMNGRIRLESTPQMGSRFEIIIPAAAANIEHSRDRHDGIIDNVSSNPDSCAQTLSILIVEDDDDILNLLLALFEKGNHHISTARDGSEAIDKALRDSPDIVLMDLNVPKISGLNATSTLREKGFNNPIFALSAWTSSEHKELAMAAGCNEYLFKPLDIPHLRRLVQDYSKANNHSDVPSDRIDQLTLRFRNSLPEKLESLRRIIGENFKLSGENHAVDELHLFCHRLSGSGALYGFESMSKAAKELDNLLLEHDPLRQQPPHDIDHLLNTKINTLRQIIEESIATDIKS